MSAVGDDVVLKTQLYSRPISGMTAKFAAHARLFSPANPLQCLFPEHRTESIYNHHWRLEKLRYQSPVEARIAFQSTMPLAA